MNLGQIHTISAELPSNYALERTVMRGGRPMLAKDCALAGAEERWWPAAQQDR